MEDTTTLGFAAIEALADTALRANLTSPGNARSVARSSAVETDGLRSHGLLR